MRRREQNIRRKVLVVDDELVNRRLLGFIISRDYDVIYAENGMQALAEKQFIVYYQPKYDISGDKPRLTSAESLIRWMHPEFGMISPGVFIPLFEENGLIQRLDRYVWNEAAAQIRPGRTHTDGAGLGQCFTSGYL